MKRGAEIVIVLLVVAIAAIGLWSNISPGKAVSTATPQENCMSSCYENYEGDQLMTCLNGCYVEYVPKSEYDQSTGRYWTNVNVVQPGDDSPQNSCRLSCLEYTNNDMLRNCMNKCDELNSVGDYYYNKPDITGDFASPVAKAYGGDIRGVASSNSRAFAGRAYQMPAQACYKCSCLTQGLTAVDQVSASRVCSENCGGTILEVKAGACII